MAQMRATDLRALGMQRQLDSAFHKGSKLSAEVGPKKEGDIMEGGRMLCNGQGR